MDLRQLKPFEGKARIRLLGLPDKVSAPERELTSKDESVSFPLTVDGNCVPGSFRNLFCGVDVPQDGHVIPHNVASGGILRILPEKREPKKLAAAGGKGK